MLKKSGVTVFKKTLNKQETLLACVIARTYSALRGCNQSKSFLDILGYKSTRILDVSKNV